MSFFQTEAFLRVAEKWMPKEGYCPPFPVYPEENQDLRAHLLSHSEQAVGLSGLIPEQLMPIVHVFIGLHDYGYSAGGNGLLDLEYYRGNKKKYFAVYRNLAKDCKIENPDFWADKAYQYVLNALEITDPSRLFVKHIGGRVIPHAVNSMQFVINELTQAGAEWESAYAFAKLIACHHLGFPLDPLVMNYASALGIPLSNALKLVFLIGGSPFRVRRTWDVGHRGELVQCLADNLREDIAEETAKVLGIDSLEARTIAALTYGLDRITALRRMKNFVLREGNEFEWTGGETAKRYGLVIGNLYTYIKKGEMKPDEADFRSLYEESLVQFNAEAKAARVTAWHLHVFWVHELLCDQGEQELQTTEVMQREAVKIMDDMGIGLFKNIDWDIFHLISEYRKNLGHQAMGYLLGTMLTCRPHIKRIFGY